MWKIFDLRARNFEHLFFLTFSNPTLCTQNYMDGIDDAIWWSCTTVTTVGYGDKFPVTNAGRLFALVWMFSGAIFLGLFAGAVSSSMSAASTRREWTSISQLPRTTSTVCTSSTYYGALYLDPLGIQHYTNHHLNACMDDLIAGKATAVLYDTKDLKYQFKINPTLSRNHYIVSGRTEVMLAPAFSRSSLGGSMYSAVNAALTEIKTETLYTDLMGLYYPAVELEGSWRSDSTDVDWWLAGPAIAFMMGYWMLCVVSSVREGECECCGRWLRGSNGEKKEGNVGSQGTDVKQEEEKQEAIQVQVRMHSNNRVNRRKKSFMVRASDPFPQRPHHVGHNRTLFLDSPEFVALSHETHSVHRLLIEQADHMDTMMSSIASMVDVKKKMQHTLQKEDEDGRRNMEGEVGLGHHAVPGSVTKTISLNLADLLEGEVEVEVVEVVEVVERGKGVEGKSELV